MTFPTYTEARRYPGGIWKFLYDKVKDAAAGVVAAGSISSDELANGSVVEAKLGTKAVATGKIADDAVTNLKLADDAVQNENIKNGEIGYEKTKSEQKPGLGAGIDLAKLTTAFGDPATLTDGFVATYKDTSDSNAGYVITVSNGVFQKTAKLTPVTA